MAIIFHITTLKAWNRAVGEGTYRTETFPIEGFIHCSTRDQVIKVANIRFRDQTGLVLLSIDTDEVAAEVVYENLEGGQQLFPHIYGELNTEAVVHVAKFAPETDGYFTFPNGEGIR